MSFISEDPLGMWIMSAAYAPDASRAAKALKELEASLAASAPRRSLEFRLHGATSLSDKLRPIAESLYRRVVAQGGAGSG